MHLIYFDENKYSQESPFFFIGGILLPEQKLTQLENTLRQIQYNFFGTEVLIKGSEFHGKEIFHGKGNCKGKKLEERLKLFSDLATFVIQYRIPIRLICIDVNTHRAKYTFPTPEYRLGLMLALERFCDYLDKVNDIGMVFGDYEADEITSSILDFSQFKMTGKTSLHFGRPLGRLIDTIYFTQSHHSRFLQVADVLVWMANRFENPVLTQLKWHEEQVKVIWEKIKANTDFLLQRWP